MKSEIHLTDPAIEHLTGLHAPQGFGGGGGLLIMNGSYQIFHLPGIYERDKIAHTSDFRLSLSLPKLESPTIKISNQSELYGFKKENPWFNPIREGFEFQRVQGWLFGELGIWASSILAWKKLLESNFDWVLILEDDCLLDDSFLGQFQECVASLPSDWQIYSHLPPTDQLGLFDESKHGIGSPKVCRSYQFYGLACYAVNRAGVKELLDLTLASPLQEPVDDHVYRHPEIRSYTIRPDVEPGCHLVELESTIRPASQVRQRLSC